MSSERPEWDAQFAETEDERFERWSETRRRRKAEGKCWQCAKLIAECACPNVNHAAPSRMAEDTLRARHNALVAKLTNLPVPPRPDVYMRVSTIQECMADDVKYLRAVFDAFRPVCERIADDAADYGGARIESFDIVLAAIEDFLDPVVAAAEREDA